MHYQAVGKEPPMGLASCSVEQLQKVCALDLAWQCGGTRIEGSPPFSHNDEPPPSRRVAKHTDQIERDV